jgi:23S rRNA (uracil1939-C5)-methyltransferase
MQEKLEIKVNDILEVEIMDINHRGQGVARIDGYVVFVNDLIMGDAAKIRIVEKKKKYGLGKLVELLKKSECRVEPECEYFWQCGGCQIMHMDYKKQLEYKKTRVESEIRKAVGENNIKINDTLGMENPYRYRNKGTFPVARDKGVTAIGAYKLGTHNIVDLDQCIIQNDISDRIVNTFRELMNVFMLDPYDERTHKGLIKHLMVRSNKKNEIMLIIVTSKNKLPNKSEIISKLLDEVPEIKSIVLNINERQPNVTLGKKNKVIYGKPALKDWLYDLEFSISPHSFFQVNPFQTEVLYDKALEYAELAENKIVYDIYCGIGTISLAAAKKSKHVYGIEIVQAAIDDAKKNAEKNNIDNADFYCGKAEDIFPKLHSQGIDADIVIVDPPRKGCEKSVLETIINMKPDKVVYVSCNPATLARDLKILGEGGYEIMEVQPVDMFPHSTHVEAVTLLTKYADVRLMSGMSKIMSKAK